MPEPVPFFADLAAEAPPVERGIHSQTLDDGPDVRLVLFSFAAGEELSEHTAARPAIVHVLDGAGDAVVGGERHALAPGTWFRMPPGMPHSIRASTPLGWRSTCCPATTFGLGPAATDRLLAPAADRVRPAAADRRRAGDSRPSARLTACGCRSMLRRARRRATEPRVGGRSCLPNSPLGGTGTSIQGGGGDPGIGRDPRW